MGDGWLAICDDNSLQKVLRLYEKQVESQGRSILEFFAHTTEGIKKVRMTCHTLPDRDSRGKEFFGSLKIIE